METVKASDVEIERCASCGGIFFDNFEFKKLDEAHEGVGSELLVQDQGAPYRARGKDEKLACPKCIGIIMMRRFSSAKRSIEVDECAGCGGIWLDPGELTSIREEFKTEDERRAAADRLFAETFGQEMNEASAKNKRTIQNAESMKGMTGFIFGRRRRH